MYKILVFIFLHKMSEYAYNIATEKYKYAQNVAECHIIT